MKKKKTGKSRKLPFQITDVIWDQIQPFLADCPKVYVGNPEKCRLFLSAILWIAREDTKWPALPDGYGNRSSIYKRFHKWCEASVFESLQKRFCDDVEISTLLSPLYAKALKTRIKKSLRSQGFKVRRNQICLPDDLDKKKIRVLHEESVRHKIEDRKKGLVRHEPSLLQRFASGKEIVPDKIYPELIEVHSGSEDELLFRYASLHWSIPVSSGYGRRLRFLVMDQHTGKLMGLFGLGDPVFSLRHRDQWVGWNKEDRNERLHHVVDAYVLGAVPPYSFLIGGKLIALLATSNEVREAFKDKYGERTSVIRERKNAGEIALVTTISALERSSLYNRLICPEPNLSAQPNVNRLEDIEKPLAFECVGHTQGFGEFHFSNGIYGALRAYAELNATATASHASWGTGFRNRQEVVKKALDKLGLPSSWHNHGIKREIYVAPLGKNTREFLRGEDQKLEYYDQPVNALFNWFRIKWLLPRSKQNEEYRQWNPQKWELWGDEIESMIKRENVTVSHREKSVACKSKSKQIANNKRVTASNDENEHERLIVKAIDLREKLKDAFENHEISGYLTYEKFLDVCISKRKVSTTAWRACAISDEAIMGFSNHLRVIRIAIAAFETLIKGINYEDGGAAWIRKLLIELKSEVSTKSATGKDSRERRK